MVIRQPTELAGHVQLQVQISASSDCGAGCAGKQSRGEVDTFTLVGISLPDRVVEALVESQRRCVRM